MQRLKTSGMIMYTKREDQSIVLYNSGAAEPDHVSHSPPEFSGSCCLNKIVDLQTLLRLCVHTLSMSLKSRIACIWF